MRQHLGWISGSLSLLSLVVCLLPASSFAEFSPVQRWRAESLISLFENGTTELQYSYIENLHDGRGFTFGRAGFTTKTGDGYLLVRLYSRMKPNNHLASYLRPLRRLAIRRSSSTKRIQNFQQNYERAIDDVTFRKAQDKLVDRMYFLPAMKFARECGIRSALGKAILYDSIIQHGNERRDPDGLKSLLARTKDRAQGYPREGISEKAFLKHFLKVRRETLLEPQNTDTRSVWRESVTRVDVFRDILEEGNLDLVGPIHVQSVDYRQVIP